FFSIAALVILSVSSTFAQEVSVGLRGGVNFSTLQGKDVEGLDYATGLDIALPVELSFSKNFALQPELHFIQKGAAIKYEAEGVENEIRAFQNYLELPILLKGKIGNDKISGYAIAGPTLGYALSQRGVLIEGDDKTSDSVDFTDEQNRFEIGANFGLGAELQAGLGKVVVDARYGLGLSGLTKSDDLAEGVNNEFNSGIAV
ncbi:porin family protein, partial [Xanthovirga aplysinae]|uniref:porin family protein n=1 Tax=Xanthovirga aplysinae TaxID=2529853 RepID=UPI0012BB8BEB